MTDLESITIPMTKIAPLECETSQYKDSINDEYRRDFNNKMGCIVWNIL